MITAENYFGEVSIYIEKYIINYLLNVCNYKKNQMFNYP